MLARRSACAIARESIAARYAVVLDDVVFASGFSEYREGLRGSGATVEAVTLLPSVDAVLARNAMALGLVVGEVQHGFALASAQDQRRVEGYYPAVR